MKLAGALSGFITGTGLSLIGFIPDAVQTPAATAGIRGIMGGIPMLFSVIYLIIYWKFYQLDGDLLKTVKLACRKTGNLPPKPPPVERNGKTP